MRPIDVSDTRRAEGWAVKMVSDLKGGADNVEGLQENWLAGRLMNRTRRVRP